MECQFLLYRFLIFVKHFVSANRSLTLSIVSNFAKTDSLTTHIINQPTSQETKSYQMAPWLLPEYLLLY